MYIIIDEDGSAFHSKEKPEGVEEAVDAGIWSLINVGIFPPKEYCGDGIWVETADINKN